MTPRIGAKERQHSGAHPLKAGIASVGSGAILHGLTTVIRRCRVQIVKVACFVSWYRCVGESLYYVVNTGLGSVFCSKNVREKVMVSIEWQMHNNCLSA